MSIFDQLQLKKTINTDVMAMQEQGLSNQQILTELSTKHNNESLVADAIANMPTEEIVQKYAWLKWILAALLLAFLVINFLGFKQLHDAHLMSNTKIFIKAIVVLFIVGICFFVLFVKKMKETNLALYFIFFGSLNTKNFSDDLWLANIICLMLVLILHLVYKMKLTPHASFGKAKKDRNGKYTFLP
jgi:ABC-type Fe3+-siderophore transport system permease subunit